MRTLRANITVLIIATIGLIGTIFGCASQSGPTPAGDQTAQSRMTAISSVRTSPTEEGVQVVISADGPLTFSSVKQPDPPAVVLYFPETRLAQDQVVQPENDDLISDITVRPGNGQGPARLEIRLAADVPYTAAQEGNTVMVDILKSGGAKTATSVESAASATPSVTARPEDARPVQQAPVQTAGARTVVPGSTAWVNKIDFVSEADGKSTIMVATTHPVDYRINKVAPQRLELLLLNTKIPSYHQRPLITTRFNSAVDRVMPTQPSKAKSESVISIELRQSVPYFAEQTENMLFIHFEPSTIPPKPLEQAGLPAWKRVLSDVDSTAGDVGTAPLAPLPPVSAAVGAAQAPLAAAPDMYEGLSAEDVELQALSGSRRKEYTGEKIALDFYETDIKNVFRILREVSGKNFAIDKNVTGKVTMTLEKPVPWDQILDLVLRMNQLGMTEDGQIIRIATLETLKSEDELKKSKLEALRKAREEARALEPLVTRYMPVSYSNAKTEIKPHLDQIITKDRGTVSVDEKNNQVIITDTVAVIRKAEEIIRRIDKVTAQVIIEARVVEVSDSFSRELGIDWTLGYGPGGLGGFSTTTDVAMNFPSSSATSSVGIGFTRLAGVPFVLNATLNALETNGDGKILSSPKILTLDNKKATIKQGVEYPYLERDSSGGSSVKFKDIDLLLEVTPHVTPDDRISMFIMLTKNDVGDILDGVPAVNTNEAQTELLVNDGDTVVIGGIIKHSETNSVSGWPGLHKIPILGWLFKSTTTSGQGNELLIFITPRIVQLEQVALPE